MLDSTSEHTKTLSDSEGHVAMDSSVVERSEDGEKAGNLSDHDGIQFTPSRLNNGDESGVCSPPLWSKSPPRSPVGSKFSQNRVRNSPPSLRVQAIARGQKELMEMVKSMPESSYELSLKDLVDHHKVGFQEDDEAFVDQENSGSVASKKQGSAKKQASMRKQASVRKQPSIKKIEKKIARTASNMSETGNSTGLFLKMVFPMPFGGSKKQVAKPNGKPKTKENPYSKVSTKHVENYNSSDKSSKGVDQKQWWQRRYSVVSDDSESGGLSSNGSSGSSGSSGSNDSTISNKSTRKKGGLLRGCSPFHSNRKKKV